MSPFTSLRNLAEDLVGSFLKYLIWDRFDNLKLIKKISCAILFIHGQKDSLINFKHSISLKNECKCPYEVILPEDMTHNSFNFKQELLYPLANFLKKNTNFSIPEDIDETIKIPISLYDIPKNIQQVSECQAK